MWFSRRAGAFSAARKQLKAWKSLPRATVAIRAPFGFAGGRKYTGGSANVFGGRVEPRENVAGWGHLFPRYILPISSRPKKILERSNLTLLIIQEETKMTDFFL